MVKKEMRLDLLGLGAHNAKILRTWLPLIASDAASKCLRDALGNR
jgi:hypothetical protein